MTAPEITPIPTPYAVASEQIARLTVDLGTDYASRLPLPWTALNAITGPLLPGALWVVGAKTGNGKTTLLANWFSALFRSGRKTLYIVSADGGHRRLRRLLLAMHCDFDRGAVMRNDWANAALGVGGRPILSADEALTLAMAEARQQQEWGEIGMVYDAPTLNNDTMRAALKYGLANGAEVVIVDHINRWSAKSSLTETQEIGAAVKGLAGVASDKGLVVLLAAQITEHQHDANPIRQFAMPPLSWLAQTSALRNEPHVALMCYRAVRPDVKPEDVKAVVDGQRQAADLIEPDVVCVGVAKDRDGGNVGRMARLRLRRSGLLEEYRGEP